MRAKQNPEASTLRALRAAVITLSSSKLALVCFLKIATAVKEGLGED